MVTQLVEQSTGDPKHEGSNPPADHGDPKHEVPIQLVLAQGYI